MAGIADADTISNASFSASTITTLRPRRQLVAAEDTAAEVALQEQISALLARTTRSVVRRPSRITGGVDGEVQSFLRANGISLDGSVSYMNEDTLAATSPPADNDQCELQQRRQQEEDMREMQQLVRRLDSERRSLRQCVAHLKKELDLRLAERAAARRRAIESHHRNLQLESLLAAARRRARAMEEKLDNCTEELMRLRRLVRSLPSSLLATLVTDDDGCSTTATTTATTTTTAALMLVPDRRFEEAFRDKMGVIAYKRRYRRMRELYTTANARLEALCMSHDDTDATLQVKPVVPCEDDAGHVFLTARPHNGGDDGARCAVNVTPAAAPETGLQAWRLTFSPITPEDHIIRGLLTQTRYTVPLRRAREELLRLASRLTESQNRGVNDMYGVFLHFLRRTAPADAREGDRRIFETQMAKMQQRLHDLLRELVRRVNQLVSELVAVEKGEGGGDTAASLPGVLAATRPCGRDVACSAVCVSDAEFAVHRLERQMEQQKCAAWTTQRELQQKLEATMAESHVAREAALAALTHFDMLQKAVCAAVPTTTSGHEGGSEAALFGEQNRFDDTVLADPRLAVKLSERTEWVVRGLRRLSCPATMPRETDETSSNGNTATSAATPPSSSSSPPRALRPGRENVPPAPQPAAGERAGNKAHKMQQRRGQKQRRRRHSERRETVTQTQALASPTRQPLVQAMLPISTVCLPTAAARSGGSSGRILSCGKDTTTTTTTTITDAVKTGSIAIPRPHPHELAPIQNKASRLRAATVLARRNTMPTLASTISYIDGTDLPPPSSPNCMARSLRARPYYCEV